MKILKYLLFLLLIVFIASSIYIATKEGDYQLEESRIIEAPAPVLYEEIQHYPNWEAWSWLGSDVEVIYSDTLEGEGARVSWQNGSLNDGSLRTSALEQFGSIEQKLLFDAGMAESEANMYWRLEPLEEGTRVTWGLQGSQSFKEKLAYTLRNGNITDIFAPRMEEGLQRMEERVIAKMEEFSIKVNGLTQHGGGYYMYQTTAARMSEVHERGAGMIQQVTDYMQQNEISINGKPFILYNERDEDNATAIFSAALPTPSQVITPTGSPVLTGYLPSQRVLKTTLKGNHKNANRAWQEAYDYISENELSVDPQGESFEIYITNPAEQENPALWVTEIYIPIE